MGIKPRLFHSVDDGLLLERPRMPRLALSGHVIYINRYLNFSHQVSPAEETQLWRDLPLGLRRQEDALRREVRLRLQGRVRATRTHPQGMPNSRYSFGHLESGCGSLAEGSCV